MQDHYVLLGWWAVLIVLLIVAPGLVVRCYLVPLALFAPFSFFVSQPEHHGTVCGRDALTNTRSITSNIVMRAFYWNNNYHTEHHACPSVPWYNLPALRRQLSGKLVFCERSYLGFHARLIWTLLTKKQVNPSTVPSP